MKNVTIIGASGYVGSALLQETLKRDYQVKAIVRHPEKINIENNHLQIIKGNVTDIDEVYQLLNGSETVISAYNPGWQDPHIYDDIVKGYQAIIEGSKRAGVKRLLITGGAGRLYIAPGIRLVDSGEIPPQLLNGVKGQVEVYTKLLLPEKEIDWVFLSPSAILVPGQRTGHFRIGKDDLITDENGESRISIEDFAVAMLNELETPKHHRQGSTVGY